jgi:hypothetical protein
MIRGLLQAWAVSDDEIELQIKNAKDQIFVKTAEARFLDYLGNNVGVDRDPGLGMEDSDFRNLIPVMSFLPKQVRKTIIALLDVFWGPGFTRANINSGNVETFNFGPVPVVTGTVNFIKGNTKIIGVGTLFTSEIQAGDYIKPTLAPGTEYQKVSAVISDTELQLTEIWKSNIALNTTVAKGVIRELEYIVDSYKQSIIRFKPNAFFDLTAVTISELVTYINKDIEHNKNLTASVYQDPIAGNRLNLRTNTPGLLGSIQILGGDANTITRLNFSLEKQTEVKASVYELNPNELVVKIPSSVPILRRSLKGSAHLKSTKSEIFSNSEIFDFSSLGASSTLTLDIDTNPFVVTFTHAVDFADITRVTCEEVINVINSQLDLLRGFTHFDTNFKKIGLRTTEGSSEYQITGGTANSILGFATTLQQDPDIIIADYPSSYIFDPNGQLFTVTETRSNLSAIIPQGSNGNTVSLSDASSFPSRPGKIILNFGRSQQEGPISYNSRPNNSTLLLDGSHIFEQEHLVGRMVNLISNSSTLPRVTGDDYAVYVVGTEEARIAAQKLIRKLIAAGVVIRFIIEFPEYLFECECRECGPPEDPDYRGVLSTSSYLVF